MAIILKSTKTFSDNFSSGTNTTYYGVVDQCNINKLKKIAYIALEIYIDEASRDAKVSPRSQFNYTVTGADFDTYFGISVLDVNNQFNRAYAYILAEVREPSTLDEAGEEVQGALTWADWESDEV